MRALFAFLLAAGLLVGCRGPCRVLSDRLCECLPSTTERDQCYQEVSTEQGRITVTGEDELQCEALLETCLCRDINTREGKEACGLARTP